MTHIDETDAIDTWMGALRSDYEPTPSLARESIAARLAGAGLTAAVIGSAAVVADNAATLAKTAPRGFLYSKAFVALATLPVGVMLGAAGHAWLARPAVSPVATRTLPAVSAMVVAVEPTPAAVAPSTVDRLPASAQLNSQPTAPKARPSINASAAPDTPGLELELRLLEQARTKLSEGQPAATLEQLRQHRAQFPQSALEQEREALSVRALMAAGRRAEAQKRAAAFVEHYPKSMLRGSVERAVGNIP